jgi:signal transduction histidine kinase
MILAQEKIKKSKKKLKKLNQLKSELLRRTSHELKTPLVSIKGFTNLLLELNEDDLEESSIEIVSEIKQGCNRLENLISDILMAAKLESGKIQINKEKINLSKLITNAVKSLRGIAKSREQSIKLEINKDLYIQGDPKRILEVIENLILNAIKYTPSKGTIIINSKSKKKDVIISIDDTGIGFTEEEKKDLFKQFGKIERYGAGHDVNIDGSGLGLYISRKIIEIHGGKIWMESEGRNKGSTFYFSLPFLD